MTSTPLTRERIFGLFLLAPCFLFITVFAFYPIVYSFVMSMHRIVTGLPRLGEPYIGLDNYRQLLHDRIAIRAFVNTTVFVIVSTLSEVIIGILIALVINREIRGRGVVRAAILIPWAIPTVVASQMWRFIFNDKYGIINYVLFGSNTGAYHAWLADPASAFISIVVADVWKTSSFAALIILAGLQVIPDELHEAAKIDGAGAWQRFWKITLPLLKPAILVALLFRTMDALRVFDLVYVMTQGGPADATNVLQFYGYKKIFAEGLMGYGSTISVLVFSMSLIISVFYIRIIGTRLFRHS